MGLPQINIEHRPDLLGYLRATGRIGHDEEIQFRILAGGVSNRSVWIRRASGEAWVLKQALAKLRVKVDWFSDPSRIHREALGLVWLDRLVPGGAIAPLVFEDAEHHLLAMHAVPEPHENWKTMLMRGDVQTGHIEQFASLLAAIHRDAWQRRAEIRPIFDDRDFFESLRIEPYYLYSCECEPRARSFLNDVVHETRRTRDTLVHGDYSPKNILVRDGHLVLLDHEVIHFGEPAFDVGFAMTHLLSKGHHLADHRGAFVNAAHGFWETYREGIEPVPWLARIDERCVSHTLSCLLARVVGRSPLEYLDEVEKHRQRELAVRLMQSPPASMPRLIDDFADAL
jgi:hypothetical protein